jgi:pimeloyl-ACP methyl ester carboxylesterase
VITHLAGADIAYDDVGSGIPVVLLHAFPLDRTMWAPQLGALVANARCIAPDFRGMGCSSVVGPFSMDRYADDTVGVLDALRIDHAVFVGLSMGGYVAFNLFRRHRDRVRALVLSDTRAAADTPEGLERREVLIETARTNGSTAVAALQLDGLIGKTTRKRHPDVVDAIHARMTLAPVEGVIGALQAMMRRPDSTALLGSIDAPTLIIVGEEDVVTPPKEARAMHDAIRGSRLEVIEKAGHLSNIERPAAFNTVVSEFLGGLLYH